jgi:hypothetical protein
MLGAALGPVGFAYTAHASGASRSFSLSQNHTQSTRALEPSAGSARLVVD